MARNLLARTGALLAAIAALALSGPARAAINVSSDGSDGVFNPTTNVQVDLSQAVTGTWNANNAANAGKGIYDPGKWAVVFKYASVNIPTGVTVTFKNHLSGAPVVWLVQGNATIAGTVLLDGANGAATGQIAEPGPGGFSGGAGATSLKARSGGFGPGGGSLAGNPYSAGGGYGSGGETYAGGVSAPMYGNAQILPLIGGSGGTGYINATYDGGAGGGAILIASSNTISLPGAVYARGGGGGTAHEGGSGGAIRLICDSMTGSGAINANGAAYGGNGRVRIECNTVTYTGSTTPGPSTLTPITPLLTDPVIWPPTTMPSILITQIAGIAAPADPHTVLSTSAHFTTVDLAPTAPVTVRLNAKNMPLDWIVKLRVVPFTGSDFTVNATMVSGDAVASVWDATITAARGISAIQARATKP